MDIDGYNYFSNTAKTMLVILMGVLFFIYCWLIDYINKKEIEEAKVKVKRK